MLVLPELVLLESFSGDWDKYLEKIYHLFCDDFVKTRISFKGIRLGLKKYPLLDGKEATFWHIISEGKIEAERVPDLRRCERIKWPRPLIEGHARPNVKVWENQRGAKKNICLCYGDWEYLVILSKRDGYLLPWTAYPVTYKHTREKLIKEYNNYASLKANTAQESGVVTPFAHGK